MALLKCSDLTIGFDNLVLYEHLSFEINKGDYVFVIGENGAGKSSLMRTLLGLIKPLHGTIETGDGLEANEIGYLPQQTVVQRDFPASCKEIVLSGRTGKMGLRPFFSKEDKRIAREAMVKFGVDKFENKCYRELSGGQQQRVMLARTFCSTSKMMLLDEPVAGLDPYATEDLYQTVKELNDEGVTIIMISHDIPAANKYASHILHIKDEPSYMTRKEYFTVGKGAQFKIFGEEK